MSYTNISKPTSPTYTNISKPSGTSYTNIAKPILNNQTTILVGMTLGLLIPLTNAVERTTGTSFYTNIPKPT